MVKTARLPLRITEQDKATFTENSKRIGFKRAAVLLELINRFNNDAKLQNSVRVSLELKS